MTRRRKSPAKPWSKKKARARVLSPDQLWAARITQRVLRDCHPWQRAAAIDPAKRISMLVGRGGAKTTTMRARAILKVIWLRNQYVGYAATSADQARELNWDKIPSVCEAYGITTTGPNPDVTLLDTKMVMRCHRTGSVYRMRGVEDRRDANRFRGFPQAEFQVDECGSFEPTLLDYLIDQCVAQRLGEALTFPPGFLEGLIELDDDELEDVELVPDRGGCITLGSTPPAMLAGPFYEATRDGSDQHRPYELRDRPEYEGWIRFSSHAWTLKDVVDLPNARELYPALVANWEEQLQQKLRKGWGDDHPIWQRESLARWSADNTTTVFRYRPHVDGKPHNQWDPLGGRPLEGLEALKIAIDALPKDVGSFHYALTMDSGGTRDPFAANIFGFAPTDPQRQILHVFCFERMRMHARSIAELLIGPEPEKHPGVPVGGLFSLIGWPDVIEFDADQVTIDELANVYGLQCRKSDRKADYKFGAIELTNGDFLEGRIKIIKGSALERQLETLQWRADEYGILRENKAQPNHSTDCLIYARRGIANLFEDGRVAYDSPRSPGDPDALPGLDHGLRADRGEDGDGMYDELPDDFDDSAWGL